jgi:thioredoxin 1
MLAASNTHEDSTMSTNVRTPDVRTPDVRTPDIRTPDVSTVNVRILNDAEFSQVIDHSDQPVLVDFWADWCGPCHAIAPVLDELARDLDGQVTFAKINVDQNPATTARFGIRSIPALFLFRDGKAVAQHAGVASYHDLKRFITQAI